MIGRRLIFSNDKGGCRFESQKLNGLGSCWGCCFVLPFRHADLHALFVIPSGHKLRLPLDRMTAKLKSRQPVQVFEKQHIEILVIGGPFSPHFERSREIWQQR
jgi:hypothetical protein